MVRIGTVKLVHEDFLTLLMQDTNELLNWPVNGDKPELKEGQQVKIELSNDSIVALHEITEFDSKAMEEEEKRRKLLEQLVN